MQPVLGFPILDQLPSALVVVRDGRLGGAFGTAAEYPVVPASQTVSLPGGVSFEQGACLGIPAITAHRCAHAAGPVEGRTVLAQGGAGAVGICALQLASRAGATLIAAVRATSDDAIARIAGAHHVVHVGPDLVQRVRALGPNGVNHIVEVAFGANIATDLELLAFHGSITTYATDSHEPRIPFWPLLFKNIRVDFLGSDDFTPADKAEAARAVNEALGAGWAPRRTDPWLTRRQDSLSIRYVDRQRRPPSAALLLSLAGGAKRHLEVESLCFLEMIDHLEKIASLRIAAGTQHTHQALCRPFGPTA